MTKLLLVSDNNRGCHLLQQSLEQNGYDVVTTHRGGEGLLVTTAALPDLILVDMATSVVSGWQIIHILKTASATQHIPVIAIANPTINGQRLIGAGFDTYVRKPLSFRHLSRRINTLLNIASTETNGKVQTNVPPSSTIPHGLQEIFPSPQQGNTTQVVYVDDRPVHDQTGATIIQRAGYDCVRIADALQDISQLLDLQPQLIFIDLTTPISNSYRLCNQIRQIPQFATTPLIIVTDNDNIIDRVRARIAGASDFVHKPIKTQRVLQMLIKYRHGLSMER